MVSTKESLGRNMLYFSDRPSKGKFTYFFLFTFPGSLGGLNDCRPDVDNILLPAVHSNDQIVCPVAVCQIGILF